MLSRQYDMKISAAHEAYHILRDLAYFIRRFSMRMCVFVYMLLSACKKFLFFARPTESIKFI